MICQAQLSLLFFLARYIVAGLYTRMNKNCFFPRLRLRVHLRLRLKYSFIMMSFTTYPLQSDFLCRHYLCHYSVV